MDLTRYALDGVTPARAESPSTPEAVSALIGGAHRARETVVLHGGGTRIGESLATFNRWHAPSVIHSRTCVMIISDGYDTGDGEGLGPEMRQLAKRCKRIVWLNPMLGWDGYEPAARGMQAAMPYIDLFAPAHNLKSLAALEPYLAKL